MSAAPSGRKRRNGLAAFRAVELEVQAALHAGRTVLAIFEEKRDRLGMSYAQFARYAQPLRNALRGRLPLVTTPVPAELRPLSGPRPRLAAGSGPPRGRPEDAVPRLDMDGFATKALTKKDLF